MLSILYAELNIFCIVIVGMMLRRVFTGVDTKHHKCMLMHMLASSMLSFVFDLLWVLGDSGAIQVSIGTNYLINICYFLSSGALCCFWYLYADAVMEDRTKRNLVKFWITILPTIIYTVLIISTVKTGWFFYITEDGTYYRGPLFFVHLIITYGYISVSAVRALFMALNKNNWAKRSQYLSLLSFSITPLAFSIAQIFIQGVPLVSAGITIAILSFYLNYLEQQISLDALTQLNNRRQLFRYLEGKIKHADKDNHLYLLMMDLDYFKKINDQYGHIEGDHALVRMADVLRQASCNLNCFLSRYGGDEFTVVYETDAPKKVELFCSEIRRQLALANEEAKTPYKLSVSIGYTTYTKDYRTTQDFIHAADNELYKAKAAR